MQLSPFRSSRREFLRAGLTGFSSLTLGGMLRSRTCAEALGTKPRRNTAVILVWLRGGASHIDTFDPKPLAPVEYRGVYAPIRTNVSGIQICELLPRLARIADRYALIRSLSHTGGGHPAGSLQVLGGDPDAQDKLSPVFPDWMSVASYLRRDPDHDIPNYVAINPVDRYDNFTIAGSTYLGPRYEPFKLVGDLSDPEFRVPNIGISDASQARRLPQRMTLKDRLDRLRRAIEDDEAIQAFDNFEAQAINLLTSRSARDAFDLSQEPVTVRQRYGLHSWGQQLLMARRLVEAGVEVIATEFDGPLCGRVANWDDHAVNHHVFDALKFRLPTFDQAVSALIEDVYQRGLDQHVMVIVTGEFGRTPRISHVASSGGGVASGSAGTVQPGRDHWPNAGSLLIAGGGVRTGQVIGATDAKGEEVVQRLMSPNDFLATIYHHLGIDYQHTAIRNFAGRPVPIVNNGTPVSELWTG
jgi:uncharacterized protein (DUF1501 family)